MPVRRGAANLQVLTPPKLGFEIVTSTPIVMAEGTLIRCRLRLLGVRVLWTTRIAVWDPPRQFVGRAMLRGNAIDEGPHPIETNAV